MDDDRFSDFVLAMFTALHDSNWPTYFDASSYQRGRRYAEHHNVDPEMSFERAERYLSIAGQVAGNASRPYRTRIIVDPLSPDMGVVSDCSCPVGRQCKHGVALIQTFLDDAGDHIESLMAHGASDGLEHDWTEWLNRWDDPGPQPTSGPTVSAEHRLALIFDLLPGHGIATLAVQPAWLRPSRHKKKPGSGWVVPQIIEARPTGDLFPTPDTGWPGPVEDALGMLLQRASETRWGPSGRRSWSTIKHAFQARALWALLDSNEPPLLFREKHTGTEFTQGPPCELAFGWISDDRGVQHLTPAIAPADTCSDQATIARAGRELCYLDPQRAILGRLTGDPRRLEHARKAPPLPPDMSAWLDERLNERPTNSTELTALVPKPTVVEACTLDGITPRLNVHMDVAESTPAYLQRRSAPNDFFLGAGVVSFAYDDILISPEPGDEAEVFHRGQRITVKRDTEAERALVRGLPSGMVTLERLAELNDVPNIELPPWTLLWPTGDTLPDQVQEWHGAFASPDDWWPMIQRLREAGCRVTFSDDFPREPRRLPPDAWHGELEPAGNGWFDLALDIEVDGERLPLLPILRHLLKDPDFPLTADDNEPTDASYELQLGDDRFLVLPLARLRTLMAPLIDWMEDSDDDAALRLPVTSAEAIAPLAEREQWQGRGDVTALAARLQALPSRLPAPAGFQGELRDYQSRGLAWLHFLSELGSGGILADDMGLGKTIQVLAHVLDERQRGRLNGPTLVVAPTSLVGNWCAEAARFAPDLKVLALQGGKAERQRQIDADLPHAELVITTYPLLIRDLDVLNKTSFALLVLDEAQAIKNAASQTAQAVRALKVERGLAMTGTPVENHLGELWAQLDAVDAGVLGTQQWFGRHFRTPIEKEGNSEIGAQLSRRIAPLMLRRTKQQVLTELPEKTESQRDVVLSGAQRELYESLRLTQHQRVQQAVAERGLAASGIVMLDALLKLRQVCCDPRLVNIDSARQAKRSAKLEQLRELLLPLVEDGRRILVFSQFTTMLGLIGETLERDGIPYTTLTGDTPGKLRSERVAAFQNGEVPVFLISLKAGGVGLNLTAADSVIHYDPWWNPAVEAQATGRAHRLGQKNPVFVYKLVCTGTVEERIIELQARKADLASSILEGGESPSPGQGGDGPLFDEQDLALLFAPLA